MTLFDKLKDAISANINDAIDKASDPVKMANYYIGKAEDELAQTRKDLASAMADKEELVRLVADSQKGIENMQACAEKAMQAGNKDDARIALEKKREFAEQLERLQNRLVVAETNTAKLNELYASQSKNLDVMKAEVAEIKSNVAIASTQQKINANSSDKARAQFKKAQEKSLRMVDEASCDAQIDGPSISANALMDKYNETTSIDDELAELEKKYATA